MQVFDKALTEPTFCSLYSSLCYDLNKALPDFDDPESTQLGQDGKPVRNNFRRILLNKCQIEFEKGVAAMAAVEFREKAGRASAVRLNLIALMHMHLMQHEALLDMQAESASSLVHESSLFRKDLDGFQIRSTVKCMHLESRHELQKCSNGCNASNPGTCVFNWCVRA